MLFVPCALDRYAKDEKIRIENTNFLYVLQKFHQHVVVFHVHQHEVGPMDQVDHKTKE
jgi:hypothetical protein